MTLRDNGKGQRLIKFGLQNQDLALSPPHRRQATGLLEAVKNCSVW